MQHLKYMPSNMSDMNKYNYNYTQNQSLDPTLFRPRSCISPGRVSALGDNTVATRLLGPGTSTLWIYATITKDVEGTAALDCSGIDAGTLLLFAFVKNASIVVNFDILNLFTRSCLADAFLNSSHNIRIVSTTESANR